MRPLGALAAAFLSWTFAAGAEAQTLDVILRHGMVVDGTGAPRRRADVGFVGGSIVRVGDLSKVHARREYDVSGLFVAPGFVNPHSHAEADAIASAENVLRQGVTTEIINPDGEGEVGLARQLAAFQAHGLAVNLGAYVGFNSVWQAVMGQEDHRPTAADVERMRAMILQDLRWGAWGISAGLDYKPGYFATAAEVASVVSVGRAWRTNFPNHERVTPPAYSSHKGVAETIAIASDAGLTPVITHIKSQGREQGRAAALLALMAESGRHGHYVAGDVYPYLAGMTDLSALLIPAWAQDGGRAAMLARFADPALRRRIAAEAEAAIAARLAGGAEAVMLADTKETLAGVAAKLGAPPGEALVRLLETAERPAILRFGSEADLGLFLRSPVIAITCDCGASRDPDTHPRYWGTWPRILGHYVREAHLLTWEEAVRKMTSLPASTLGLVDRGLIAPGMAADVTVFDPRTIVDRATYADPTRPPEGVAYVFVGGVAALERGRLSHSPSGALLRRSPAMPTRPWSAPSGGVLGARDVRLSGAMAGALRLRIDQPRHGFARGALTVRSAAGQVVLRGDQFGFVQRARHWASLTGVGKAGDNRLQPFTLIVDAGDAARPGFAHVILQMPDGVAEGWTPRSAVAGL
jgi:N-acyl-D-aspartate/D-glutamate deacylase